MALLRGSMKGMTLAELLISMGLLFIILTAFTAFFLSSQHRFRTANAQNDVQMNANVGMERLTRDFRETAVGDVILHLEGVTDKKKFICFPSPRDLSGNYSFNGVEVDWKSWIIYYLTLDSAHPKAPDGSAVYLLVRKQVAGAIAAPPATASIPDMDSCNVDGKITARGVSSFSFLMQNSSPTQTRYVATIESKAWYSSDIFTYVSRKSFVMSNLVGN